MPTSEKRDGTYWLKSVYEYTRAERDKAKARGDHEAATVLTNILAELILVRTDGRGS